MMKEPLSVYSSIFFIAAGVLVAVFSADVYSAISFSLLGIASAGFHYVGERNNFWHRADEAMIYIALHAVIIQIFGGHPIAVVAGVVIVAIAIFNLDQPEVNTFLLVPLAGIIGILGLFFFHSVNAGLIVLGISVVAGVVRVIIQPHLPAIADPIHSAWHLLAAADFFAAWHLVQ